MAGTANDNTIPDDDWWWFRDEVAFVAERAHISETAALEYILDRLHRGEIDWCFDKIEIHFRGDAAPESDRIRIGQLFFWRRYTFVEHKVDLVNNSAMRTGAAILGIRDDNKGNPQPIYNSRFLLEMRATLIRFYHPCVMRSLQRNKFMPPPLSLAPSAQQEPTPSPSEQTEPVEAPPAQQPASQSSEAQPQKIWKRSEAIEWLAGKLGKCPLPKERRQKSAWCRDRHEEMKKDFGGNLSWSTPDSLRRRLDQHLRELDNQPGKKV